MNNETILDESFNESPPQNKWKLAILSILILIIGFSITSLLQNHIPTFFALYSAIIFGLYFFIKRIDCEIIKIGELFSWGTFIIFGAYFISNIIHLFFFSDRITDSISSFIAFNLGSLFRSIILGNMLSLGVFHLIKNKSWSMLILMILMSWVFQTMLTFDSAQFRG